MNELELILSKPVEWLRYIFMRPVRKFIYRMQSSPHTNGFCEWAFGPQYSDVKEFKDLFDNWNRIHGHELTLNENNLVHSDMEKMLRLWHRSKGEK